VSIEDVGVWCRIRSKDNTEKRERECNTEVGQPVARGSYCSTYIVTIPNSNYYTAPSQDRAPRSPEID
jgi:hypothetical protein